MLDKNVTKNEGQKIAIYGGTFDPVHMAHLQIANFAKAQFAFDRFYWVPTSTSPFKKKQTITQSKHRLKMLQIAIPKSDYISHFETQRQSLSYTKDTIFHFRQKFPKAKLYLLIGTDHLKNLHKWKNIDYIAKEAKIIVARRHTNFSKINLKRYQALLLNNPVLQISATTVRQGDFSALTPAIMQYISQNFLYLDSIINHSLSQKRAKHCFFVAKLAKDYALKNKINPEIAYYAGLLHDYTKEWDPQKHEKFLRKYYKCEKIPEYQYHEKTSALWYKHVYQGTNEKIYKAIFCHTSTCEGELDLLSIIVFCADKLAQGRKFPGIQKIRNLAFEDIGRAFKEVLIVNRNFLVAQKRFSEASNKRYKELLNEKSYHDDS